MVSKLAKSTIEKLQSEGLNPSVDDIIHLNALGLKVERGDDMYDFSVLPRTAIIGDLVFYEPTIAKRLWLDEAMKLFKDNSTNQLYLFLYAMHEDNLPPLNNISVLTKTITEFISENFSDSTFDQLFGVVDYLLNGDSPTAEEEYRYSTKSDTIQLQSYVNHLLNLACIEGFDEQRVKNITIEQLDRMLTVAYLQKNKDIVKNERVQNAGKFYVTVAKIKDRLLKEKENGKE